MDEVNIFKAKTELSKLIVMLENREEDRIIISRGKKPVAILLPYEEPARIKLGLCNGKYNVDSFDDGNDEVYKLLTGEDL